MKNLWVLSVVVIAALTLFAGAAVAGDYGPCSFESDCHSGVKCYNSKCADSAGSSCSFDSDCGGKGAKCYNSKCSNAPDGTCSFASDCPGGSCSSGKCKF